MTPQSAIFHEGSSHHYYLEFRLPELRQAQNQLQPAVAKIVAHAKAQESHLVVAFGASLWSQIGGEHPHGLVPFEPMAGVHAVPSTQGDLFFWIHGDRHDLNFDLARFIYTTLAEAADLTLELMGFVYHDSRDLIGFIDGTENPKAEAAKAAALVPQGLPGEGGSFVISQQWRSKLRAFNALSVEQQEGIVGRTKPDSIELSDDIMPPTSHVSRTDAKVDGVPQKIYRRSTPYGTVKEHGLYFLAFSCEISRIDIQLRRMFGMTEDGLYDHLTDYTTPVTSSYWFAPSVEALEAIG